MISKELFAQVMSTELPQGLCELNDLVIGDDNDIGYFHAQYQEYTDYGIQWINVYELMHKCKEWAYNNDFNLYSASGWGLSEVLVQLDYDLKINTFTFVKRLKANTEPEAIFKACQWILDTKDK